MLFIAIGAIALGAGGFFGYDAYQEATMTADERLLQANLEALTNNEDDWNDGPLVKKRCYSVFTNEYGSDFYATCSNTIDPNPSHVYMCGAITGKKPTPMAASRECFTHGEE